ncbi:MAG: winged helix-turn-helix domain-containing protein [Nitrososphaeraceae archaeon]
MLKFLLPTDAREEKGPVQLSRIISTINLNTRQKYSRILTGETQLRARRTRLKILRAIAEKNGSAGFSDIRNATGLSTGSIYYHLERMGNYIIKDSKHYLITDEGLQLLRKIDERFSSSSSPITRKKDEGSSLAPRIESEETMKKSTGIGQLIREYIFIPVIAGVMIFIAVELFVNSHTIFPDISNVGKIIANASLTSSLSIAALLSISFLLMLKRQMLPAGYRGIMLSALTVLSVLLVNILIFSGLGAQIGASSLTF